MKAFLTNNRSALVARCKVKVAARCGTAATETQLANGVPLFLDQLIRTLQAEDDGHVEAGVRISGASGGDGLALSEIGLSATAHGASLLGLGYSVDQVVHGYGDLCQSITDLAFERDAPFSVDEFRTLNRCLDNAIANAVTEFSILRESRELERHNDQTRERIGFLVHELRNAVSTASLALEALEFGNMNTRGATGAVLKRSLTSMGTLIRRAVEEVRLGSGAERQLFSVSSLIAYAEGAARLAADAAGCSFVVSPVDPTLMVLANRATLLSALTNLLQNAFKFSHAHTEISLSASEVAGQACIDVRDHCGGLPAGSVEKMFAPFIQRGADRTGLGLGLAIARESVESDFGTLSVQDMPGVGCVFTIALPLQPAS